MYQRVRIHLIALLALIATLPAAGIAAAAASKPVIRIGYVQSWSSNVASANVVAAVIHDRLGYPVKLLSLDAGPMWEGVARGRLDAIVSAWLPNTHRAYYKKLWPDVIDLGPNLIGTRIGLVVPDYVPIDSIGQLAAHRDRFRGRIIGIDPGAGIMMKTQEAIRRYGLQFRLIQSSGAAMTAMLARAERHHRWIVVTGWTPHWMWAKWKLKYLKDPKDVYGKGGYIGTVVSRRLPHKAMPVLLFLKRFYWTSADMNAVMLDIRAGTRPAVAARRWLADHPALVDRWLGEPAPGAQALRAAPRR